MLIEIGFCIRVFKNRGECACACGDFVNLEDLPAQSSKMLIEIGFSIRVLKIKVSVHAL